MHRLARLYPSALHSTPSSDELPDFALVHPFSPLLNNLLWGGAAGFPLCRSALAVGWQSRFPPRQKTASGDSFGKYSLLVRKADANNLIRLKLGME